jgi:hypothetical protein
MLSSSPSLAARYGIAMSWRQRVFYTFLNTWRSTTTNGQSLLGALKQRTPRKTLAEEDLAVAWFVRVKRRTHSARKTSSSLYVSGLMDTAYIWQD